MTAVEWLCKQYHLKQDIEIVKQAKEMEKQQQENFAAWCIKKRVDFFDDTEIGETYTIDGFVSRYKMNELLEIYKNNKTSQETVNSIIDVLNTQGVISDGDEPVLIEDDCTCDKCGKESRGSHSCPFDEEFNSGAGLDSCNCCDSCRRECLMDI